MKEYFVHLLLIFLINSFIDYSVGKNSCETLNCLETNEHCQSIYEKPDCNKKSLTISNCKISNLTCFLNTFNHLEQLESSNNDLSSIGAGYFANVPNITKINLSMNKIHFIHENAFDKAEKLEEINLSHNEITDMGAKTFVKLKNLKKLNLSFNKFCPRLDFYPKLKADLIIIIGVCCECACVIKSYPDTYSYSVCKYIHVNHNECCECDLFDECIRLYFYRCCDYYCIFTRYKNCRSTGNKRLQTSRDTTTGATTVTAKTETEQTIIFGLSESELEILLVFTITAASLVLVVLFLLILRDYLEQKEKMQKRKKKASCRPDNIKRVKAVENPYILA